MKGKVMIYNKKGFDNGLKFQAYYDRGWKVDIENDKGLCMTSILKPHIKHRKGVELWVKRCINKNFKDEKAFLTWLFNRNGEDNGLTISLYWQGSQIIADITNNSMDYWREFPLHYSITSIDDAIAWAIDYADGERLEVMY